MRLRFNWSLRLESADVGAKCTERVITGALCVRRENEENTFTAAIKFNNPHWTLSQAEIKLKKSLSEKTPRVVASSLVV